MFKSADILHKTIKILKEKEVKYDVGRVSCYLGTGMEIPPWDFVDLLELVRINKEDKKIDYGNYVMTLMTLIHLRIFNI